MEFSVLFPLFYHFPSLPCREKVFKYNNTTKLVRKGCQHEQVKGQICHRDSGLWKKKGKRMCRLKPGQPIGFSDMGQKRWIGLIVSMKTKCVDIYIDIWI